MRRLEYRNEEGAVVQARGRRGHSQQAPQQCPRRMPALLGQQLHPIFTLKSH